MPEAFATQPHSIEHIIPRVKQGTDELENLALSCQGCNNRKHVKTDAFDGLSGEVIPLFHPRQMDWSEHFAWNADYTEMIPLTLIGRVTVGELRLNRTGVRNLRRVLYAMGEHPRE